MVLQRHETTSSTQGLAFSLSTLLHARTAHIRTILSDCYNYHDYNNE